MLIHGHQDNTVRWRGQRRREKFDLQKDFEWSWAIASVFNGSIEATPGRGVLDLAPLVRSVPMPKRPMQCKCVQALPLGSPQGRLGRPLNQRS